MLSTVKPYGLRRHKSTRYRGPQLVGQASIIFPLDNVQVYQWPTCFLFLIMHQSSNTTSWERPVVKIKDNANGNPPSPDGVKDASPAVASSRPGQSASDSAVGKQEPLPLPSGWQEVKDPTTGGVYYWNQVGYCAAVSW